MTKTISGLNIQDFQGTLNGKNIDLYVLKNDNGCEVCISNYGATIISFCLPDKDGKIVDIVLGQPSISSYYENPTSYFGQIVGRYCNRIAEGKFFLNGTEYTLPRNNGPNNLHSGDTGFHNQVWNVIQHKTNYLQLSHLSPNGENGYPGNVCVNLEYTLTENNELKIDTYATTDSPTVLGITNHAFFNLNGGSCDALDAKLQIFADFITPINENMIPTGEVRPVKGTNFDFTEPTVISSRINDPNDNQLLIAKGYDHNFVLRKKTLGELSLAARAKSDKTGITLEVYTTLPGVQLYTGNFLDKTFKGKHSDTENDFRHAFCLEPQYFPDSPNKPHFPSCIFDQNRPYRHSIIFKATSSEK
ncbi:galactose mutarotase [Histomonas meleagridis]|uniref:galactose mutarotase n=1 Tax=Histomonas meleagridis TaxID=135588 RepID=UPI003559B83C|nr:galactose mutarotase [Histomonas meleagridis]KAH0803153.1 galactose mutarotase [Histomonas meleagridis]